MLWPPGTSYAGTFGDAFICGIVLTCDLLQVIVDTSISFDKRLAAAKKFMDARGCCVDEHFSEKFRNMLQDERDFVLPPIQRFLAAVLRAALASTSHSENTFAHMRKMLHKCLRPPHISTVAAQHVLVEIMRIHRM